MLAFFEVRKVPSRPAELAVLAKRVWKAVREAHNVTCSVLAIFPPRTMPKTTSGKIRRGEAKEKYLAGQLVPAFDYSARFSKALFDPLVLRVLSRVGRGNESDLLRDYFAVFLSQKYGYDCDLMFAL